MNQVDVPKAVQPFLDQLAAHHDRDAVLQIVNAMLALGYRIEPPAGPHSGGAIDARVKAVAERIEDADATLLILMALWRAREPELWSSSCALYRQLGERVLKLGAPFVALEVATEGLERWPRDVRLRQIQGLAWARSGAPQQAHRILADLAIEGNSDEETLGMLARTHKDFGLAAADPQERQRRLQLAYETYAKAFRLTGGYWTGINAATLAMLLGNAETAAELARDVWKRCIEELQKPGITDDDRYWPLATLGEAGLVLGEWSQAEEWYRQAAAAGKHRFGDLSSTRRQARLLLQHLGRDCRWFDQILRVPRVVVFAGHMIDQPGRPRPRFPVQLERSVHSAIRDRLRKLDALVGFSSAACGSDILFLEALLELKGEAHVVLPYDREMFTRDSVFIIPGARWNDRYDDVLTRAFRVVTVSNEKIEQGSVSYDYANLVLHGLACARVREIETDLVALTVWDGQPGDGPGGTASVVERWRKLGVPVERIDLAEMLRQEAPERVSGDKPSHVPSPGTLSAAPATDTQVMAILFADAVGFSKFTERQTVCFAQHCLGAIADLLRRSPHKAVVKETRGDGVYLVFETVRDAGLFALDLCDLMKNGIKWKDKDLPENLSLRIALHAGPLSRCYDPIIESMTYTGTHVSRGARLEPRTPPGQVYASQAFAALAAVEKVAEFTCDYVKHLDWAKGYGTFPTYVVRSAFRK